MEAVPWSIDLDAIIHGITDVEGVNGVHDIHVWNITIGKVITLQIVVNKVACDCSSC